MGKGLLEGARMTPKQPHQKVFTRHKRWLPRGFRGSVRVLVLPSLQTPAALLDSETACD